MEDFYSRLSYGIGNEDWETEKKALQHTPDSEILCITASGDRPLNLLTSPCKKLTAVDLNPTQTALLDLKMAALRIFDFDEYLEFLGIHPCKHRLDQYAKIEKELAPTTQKILRDRKKKIRKGIVYQGALELSCRTISRCLYLLSGNKINKLFSFDSIEEQKDFVEKKFFTPFWKKIVIALARPSLVKFFVRDPGLYAFVDPSIHSIPYLISKIEDSFKTRLAKENIVFSLVMKGKIYESHLPPYLQEEGFNKIKKNLSALHFQTVNLLDYLKQAPDRSIDRFSLSDVASYMPYEQYTQMLKEVHRVGREGARFCLRQFMSKYEIPDSLKKYFSREQDLEKQLEKEDRCVIYSFSVGTVAH